MGFRLAEDRLDAEQDLARLRLASLARGAALDVLVIRPGPGQVRLDREDRVRVARGEGAAFRRRSRLEDRGTVLR